MDAALLVLLLIAVGLIAWERIGHVRETHKRARAFDSQGRTRLP